MKLEQHVKELPPAEQLRIVDMVAFKRSIYEDVKTGHLYIAVTKGTYSTVMRLTND